MATVLNSFLGLLKGKLGNTTFRIVMGQQVASSRPGKYHTVSESARKNRNEFGKKIKFSKAINHEPLLKRAWGKAEIEGKLPFNRIQKYNLKHFRNGHPTTENIITPPNGLDTPVKSVQLNENKITITLSENYSAAAVLVLVPFTQTDDKSSRYNAFSYSIPFTGNEIQVLISEFHKKIIQGFSELIIYAAIINEENNGKISWSDSYAKSFRIE